MKVALIFLLGSVLIAGFTTAAPAGEEDFDAFTTDLTPEDAEVSPRVHPHLHHHHGLLHHHGLHGHHHGLHGHHHGIHGLHHHHHPLLHHHGLLHHHHGLHHHHHPLLHHHGLLHHHHALHHHPHHHHHTKKLLLFKIKKLLPHHHMLHLLPHLAHHHHLHHGHHHHAHHALHHHLRANSGIDTDSLIPVIPASSSGKPGYQFINPEGGQSYIQLFADNPTGQTYSIPSELTPSQNLEAVEEIDGEGDRDGNYENLELEDVSENSPRRPISVDDYSYQTPLIYYAGPQPVEYGRSVSPTKDKSIFKN